MVSLSVLRFLPGELDVLSPPHPSLQQSVIFSLLHLTSCSI